MGQTGSSRVDGNELPGVYKKFASRPAKGLKRHECVPCRSSRARALPTPLDSEDRSGA